MSTIESDYYLAHDVLALCRSAKRALRPGGRLVLVTPNAASHPVMSYDFWRDPTHVRFYDPGLLSFCLAQAGFEVEETGGNPRNDPGPPPDLWPALTPASHPTLADEVGEAMRTARKEPSWRNAWATCSASSPNACAPPTTACSGRSTRRARCTSLAGRSSVPRRSAPPSRRNCLSIRGRNAWMSVR